MLPRKHRLHRADDFRRVMRSGRRYRVVGGSLVVAPGESAGPRFGFIVSRAIGSAVVRNLVKRRLRSVAREILVDSPAVDVVFRADPTSTFVSVDQWVTVWRPILAKREGSR